MTELRAVGIDLGTTNSAVAWIDETGRSAMVRNSEGDLLTPSVVFFDDEEVVVGKEARSATAVHPDRVAEWVKRDMGRAVYSRPIGGKYIPPEVIQACILRRLQADLTATLGPNVGVVITVPAYFDEPRRKATADAGQMAGLNVLDIVNEPTAAALAFGEVLGYLSAAGDTAEEMTVLVYDLGGGTFDTTLIRLGPGDVRTLATDGDVQLGGYDWDTRLVDHVAEWFKQSFGRDPRKDLAALKRLYGAVVEAKHALTARSRATIAIDFGGYSREETVTREDFEELTADLLERTSYTTRQLVRVAELEWKDVSRVLLVGGSTRMPMVARMLESLSGIAPDHRANPDEAVARGAALYAKYLLDRQAWEETEEAPAPDFEVTNVNAHSLGIEGIEPETYLKTNVVLIPRNTPLPAVFTRKFTTKRAGQQSIVIQVLEGESSRPAECSGIGRTVVRDLPPDLPQGWPIDVTFEYRENGRLSVHTSVPGKDRDVTLEMEREVGLSEEGVARWKQAVESSSGFDAFDSMVDGVLGLSEPESEGDDDPDVTSPDAEAAPRQPSAGPTLPNPPRAPSAATPPGGPQAASPPRKRDASGPKPQASPARRSVAEKPSAGASGGQTDPEPVAPAARRRPSPERLPRWVITVIGFLVSAVVGLGLGYWILSWLFPQSSLLNLW
ncbi:MAG: Hsp70 family protein [Planctomycetota bacterium]